MEKSSITSIKNKYKCLLGMFLNQFKTFYVFFHSFAYIFSDKIVFIICNMCLFILLISFFARLRNLVGGFKKFSLWSFDVMKLLPVPTILILLMMFASLACLVSSLFIFIAVCWTVLLYSDLIAFCKRYEYWCFQRLSKILNS